MIIEANSGLLVASNIMISITMIILHIEFGDRRARRISPNNKLDNGEGEGEEEGEFFFISKLVAILC